jgi:uncharacterized protein YndB with AHSA1/START domain
MPETQDGTLERTDDGYVIRFERRFDSPVNAVWQALTEPEQLKQWTGAGEIEIDLAAGGRFISRVTGPPDLVEAVLKEGGSLETHDTVLRVEAPNLFEHTFNGSPASVVRWELSADGNGCLLRLTHNERADTEGTQKASYLAGWHDLLDSMAEVIAGTREEGTWSLERWEGHRDRYSRTLSEE